MTQSGIPFQSQELNLRKADESTQEIQTTSNIIDDIEKGQNAWIQEVTEQNDKLMKYELEAAQRKDAIPDKLVGLFPKLKKAGLNAALERGRDKAYMEGAQEWHQDVAENGDLLQIEYDAEEQRLTELEAGNNKIVGEAKARGEIDVFLEKRLRDLPWRQRHGYKMARLESHALNYPLFFDQAKDKMEVPVMTDDGVKQMTLRQATDPNHYKQIEQRIYKAYIRPFAQEDQVMAKKYLYNEMNEHEKSEHQTWATARGVAIDEDRAELNKSTLLKGIKTGGGAQSISNYGKLTEVDHGGNLGTSTVAGFDIVKGQVALGLVTEDQIRKIENDPYTRNDGVKSYWRDDRPGKVQELWDALYARQAKESQQKQTKETTVWEKAETDLLNALPDKPTKAEIEKGQEALVGLEGGLRKRSAKLEAIKKDLSMEAKYVDMYDLEAQKLADNNLLTKQRLSKFPWQIQRKYQDVAAFQDTIPSTTKVYVGAIEDMVKGGVKSTADGVRSPTSRLLSYRLQNKYVSRVADLKAAGDENAEQNAYKEIENEFDTHWNVLDKGKNEKGYILGPTTKAVVENQALMNSELSKLRTIIDLKGADSIYYKEAFFNESELKAMERGYGRQGWQPHPKAVWIASQLQAPDGGPIDVLTVINAQRAALVPPLPKLTDLPSMKGYRAIDPKYRNVLCRYNSADRSCRGWSSTGKFNEEIIPNKLAGKVKEIADRKEMNPAIIAGMIERSNKGWDTPVDELDVIFSTDATLTEWDTETLKSAAKYGYTEAWANPLTFRESLQYSK